MHSSGRGEESPEAYRGVVIPAGQQPLPAPYADQVQPAGGSPWGSTAPGTGPAAGGPQPAEATQMLPPYPGALPAPAPSAPGGEATRALPYPDAPAAPAAPNVPAAQGPPAAEATQMLPPYPGALPTPAAGPGPNAPASEATQALPFPGALPKLTPNVQAAEATQVLPYPGAPAAPGVQAAEATQMLPPYPGGAPAAGAPGAGTVPPAQPQPPAAEPAGGEPTQAIALSLFQEQQPYDPAYDSFGQPQGYGQEHGGQGFEQPPAAPQHDSDYDHLFRSDVPAPAPMRQRLIQPSPQQQYGHAQPPYGQQPYDPGHGYDDADDGRRRMSPKVLIGIVAAGCVVAAGLVVGGLLNSGGGSTDKAGDQTTAPASPSASASAGASAEPAVADAARQQAQALDALLKTSGSSRSSVVRAVASIQRCTALDTAAADLRAAAAQRAGLVTRLGGLSVDKLDHHAELTQALTRAWQASAAADTHYANWADQVAQDRKLCKGGYARPTDQAMAGNRESGTASQQKRRAVRLWNAIAEKYGLTKRQFSQL